MLALFAEIPKELWTPLGTLLAGGFTAIVAFVAVALQNRSAERRHKAELEHDARQRHFERLAELRKLVYLDALEALSDLSSVYSQLWDPNVSEGNLKEQIQKSQGTLSKLAAIANIETLKSLQEANNLASAVAPHAVSVRLALLSCKQVSDQIRSFFDRAVERHAEKVKELKLLPPGTEERKRLETERDKLFQHAKEMAKISMADLKSNAELQAKALMKGHEKLKQYERAMRRVTIAIRKDLGFEFDEAEHVHFFDTAADLQDEVLVTAFDQIIKSFSEYFENQVKQLEREIT